MIYPNYFQPVGQVVVNSSLSGVVSIAGGIGNAILVQAFTQNVRVTFDGTNPSGTSGFLLTASATPILLPLPAGGTLKFIQTAASAVLTYQFVNAVY